MIALGQNTNNSIKGKIKLLGISSEDKNKLLTLKDLFGDRIFESDSELHIYGPDSIFVFGPEDGIVLEGDDYQFETIVFSDEPGTLVYNPIGERNGVVLNTQTGLLTTKENGFDSVDITVVALFVSRSGRRFLDEYGVTVQKRTYPQAVRLEGPSRLDKETDTYTYQ